MVGAPLRLSERPARGEAADVAVRLPRRPEIDLAKGACILGVLLIHSRPLVGTMLHDYVVNRAVPVFLVMFGITSELWWETHGPQGAPVERWYVTRLRRLAIPLWGTLALWWAAVIVGAAPVQVTISRVLETFLGYLPPLPTGWFVTLVLELVVLFPILRWTVVRFGALPALVAGALITLAAHLHVYDVIRLMRYALLDTSPHPPFEMFYFFWIFAPAHFFLVFSGIVLARRPRLLGTTAAAIAAGIFVVGAAVTRTTLSDTRLVTGLLALLDVPLTIALLGAMSGIELRRPAARVLAWWGMASWGMYLGQMLIYEGLHASGVHPEESSGPGRWTFFVVLLVGATVLVTLGERLRQSAARALLPRRG